MWNISDLIKKFFAKSPKKASWFEGLPAPASNSVKDVLGERLFADLLTAIQLLEGEGVSFCKYADGYGFNPKNLLEGEVDPNFDESGLKGLRVVNGVGIIACYDDMGRPDLHLYLQQVKFSIMERLVGRLEDQVKEIGVQMVGKNPEMVKKCAEALALLENIAPALSDPALEERARLAVQPQIDEAHAAQREARERHEAASAELTDEVTAARRRLNAERANRLAPRTP